MKPTIFLSKAIKTENDSKYKFRAPYIFKDKSKWREDLWSFNSFAEIEQKAIGQGYLIA